MGLALALFAFAVVMWLLQRARRGRGSTASPNQRTLQALDLSDPQGECDFHIVGESNYQPELRRVAKSGRTFLAVLMREPQNRADSNAIVVCAEGGRTIGYLD